jgi:hypothetical protein
MLNGRAAVAKGKIFKQSKPDLRPRLAGLHARSVAADVGRYLISSWKIRTNYNQIDLSVLLNSANYGDVFNLFQYKG